MKKFAVIFDMDGTMVDNTPYHLKAWQVLFKKYDLGQLSAETYYGQISGLPTMVTIRSLFPDANEARLKELLEEKIELYKQLYAPYAVPINGLENILAELKDAGVKLAMASSATIDDIDFILSHVPVRQYFEVIIDGNRVSKGKPNPQIFLKAAADLEMQPEDCVVIEDSLAGIKAANAAGMKVVGITTGHPPDKLQPSSLIIKDFTELDLKKLADLFD